MKFIHFPLVVCCMCFLLVALASHDATAHGISRREMKQLLREVFSELSDQLDTPPAATPVEIPCPLPRMRQDRDIDSFLYSLNSLKTMCEKFAQFEKFMSSTPLAFTSKQVTVVANAFLKQVNKYITQTMLYRVGDLKSVDTIGFIKNITDVTSEKVAILEAIKGNITDLQTNKEALANGVFSVSSEQSTKNNMLTSLSKVAAQDCVFGTVSADRIVFTVDISPSMDNKIERYSKISRLEFLKQHLFATIKTLKPQQQFEMVFFCDNGSAKFGKFLQATPQNIELALSTEISTKGCKGTNIESGLKLSYETFTKNAGTGSNIVYLFSDGIANYGETNGDKLSAMAKQLSEQTKASVNTISCTMGNDYNNMETSSQKSAAAALMSKIAEATKGTFKSLDRD